MALQKKLLLKNYSQSSAVDWRPPSPHPPVAHNWPKTSHHLRDVSTLGPPSPVGHNLLGIHLPSNILDRKGSLERNWLTSCRPSSWVLSWKELDGKGTVTREKLLRCPKLNCRRPQGGMKRQGDSWLERGVGWNYQKTVRIPEPTLHLWILFQAALSALTYGEEPTTRHHLVLLTHEVPRLSVAHNQPRSSKHFSLMHCSPGWEDFPRPLIYIANTNIFQTNHIFFPTLIERQRPVNPMTRWRLRCLSSPASSPITGGLDCVPQDMVLSLTTTCLLSEKLSASQVFV